MTRSPLGVAAYFLSLVAGCGGGGAASRPMSTPMAPALVMTVTPIPLPGAEGPVSLDYLAIDRATGRLWVPAGGTASVDVLDAGATSFRRIEGFPTVEREARGKKRLMGPSSATVAGQQIFIGNRGDATVCAVDAGSMARGACLTLPGAPDGIQYVASTDEVWVTMPRTSELVFLDRKSGSLAVSGKTTLGGAPEGYAVDDGRALFYTNLEDKDRTLELDAKTRSVKRDFPAGCGKEGPRGLAIDTMSRLLFVACTMRVEVLDLEHEGAVLATLDTGEGVDNIDYVPSLRRLYVAAGKAGRLTVALVGAHGELTKMGEVATGAGARVVVASDAGRAFVADPERGQILAVDPR